MKKKTILNLSLSELLAGTTYPSNWQTDLTRGGIEALENKLKDANQHIGTNPKVKQAYQEALDRVSKARESISRFVGTFNQEYHSPA
jgi:hypothetical protein